MAWLIRQRSEAKGLLDSLKKIEKDLPEKIKAAQAKVAALDAVIPFHKVVVDPATIKGIRLKRKAIYPYGVMSKGILDCLKKAKGVPVNTAEVALHVARFAQIPYSKDQNSFSFVGDRLKAMVQTGLVMRHHDLVSNGFGLWSLAPHLLED